MEYIQNHKSFFPIFFLGLNNLVGSLGGRSYSKVVKGECISDINQSAPKVADPVLVSFGKDEIPLSLYVIRKCLSSNHIKVSIDNDSLNIKIDVRDLLKLLNIECINSSVCFGVI